MLRVGFLSHQNYLDKNTFSGTLYYMHQALKSREIQLINLGEPRRSNLFSKLERKVHNFSTSFRENSQNESRKWDDFIIKVQNQLKHKNCDVIVAPVASSEVSSLETDIPIIYLSDATPTLIDKYYNLYPSEDKFNIACQQELLAVSKASKSIYSSKWAAQSAISEYKAEADKVEVIPFGANLDKTSDNSDRLSQRDSSCCRLLFIGKDWQRKGGNIAFETLTSLIDQGVDAELVIVGCIPPPEIKHERLTVIPFLNKNNSRHQDKLNELFLQSHFLIFPTRADCSPIVICEANAFGLPVITTDVGGIPSIIKNGKNGYMLTFNNTGNDYASLIAQVFSNQSSYEQLVKSSRQEYEQRLNWDKWAESLHQIILTILD